MSQIVRSAFRLTILLPFERQGHPKTVLHFDLWRALVLIFLGQ